jgi:uncharacterized protein YjiS (DUF1127 family)
MTIIEATLADAPYARPASGVLQRAIHAVARTMRRRRTQRALGRLSDYALRDIGVRRSEIDSLADSLANGHWDTTRIARGRPTLWI